MNSAPDINRPRPYPMHHMQNAMRSHDGFTLIELLTVIAIIGILAALTFSGIGMARKQAQLARCTSNLRQIGIAANNWATDHKGIIPLPVAPKNTRYDGYLVWDKRDGNIQWIHFGLFYRDGYVTDGRIFYCPTAKLNEYDYNSQWAMKVKGPDAVDSSFRLGYLHRLAGSTNLTLSDDTNHIIMTDHFTGDYSQHNAKRINLLYRDAHVRTDKSGKRWANDPSIINNAYYEDWEQKP